MGTITLRNALAALKVNLEPICVWAYLTTPSETTIAASNVYQPVEGAFTNEVMDGWIFDVDRIKYIGTHTIHAMISGVFEAQQDDTNNLVTLAINKNDVLVTGSPTAKLFKLAAEVNSWSGICEVLLAPGDDIQIMVKANKNGSKIMFNHFQVNLIPSHHLFE